MQIIKPYHEILSMPEPDEAMALLEVAGRTCYKSENRINSDSADKFIHGMIKAGHHSIIEHINITVRFICDRGVTHELVRHRLAAYSQESTRYCNYSKNKFCNEITVIEPVFFRKNSNLYNEWANAMARAENTYFTMICQGVPAEQARSVLPNSLKTEIVMTANLREWRHVLNLRCSKAAHPQIQEIMFPLLDELNGHFPVIFGDIAEKYYGDK